MFGFFDSYFKLFGIKITYYGFLIAVGMGLGVFLACKLAKKRNLKGDDFVVLACYALPLSILGARLYYVIFSPEHYSFLEFFQIWKGGMAIYGGIIGGAIGVILYCLIHKKNFLDVADIAVVSLILGQAIGRIGCYFAGCCYGVEVTNPSQQWFPFATKIDGVWHYSTFFYESFCNFCVFVFLLIMIMKKVKTRGVMTGLYLVCYGAVRAVIETFRGDSLYIGVLKVSQLLSILLVIAGLVLILLVLDKKQNPWVKRQKEKKLTENEENNKIDGDDKNKELENETN